MAALEVHELPSARGCTYVVPASDFALALRISQAFGPEADMRVARKLGVTDAEIDRLCQAVLAALADGSRDPDALRAEVGDAARSLGMTRGLILQIVVLPQALRLAAPPYVSLCVSLVKATSLVSIVGLWELTMASREIVERTLAPFQIFIGAAAIYFCICYTLALYGRHLERRVLLGH